jgi:large subunit ribosomal protein L23
MSKILYLKPRMSEKTYALSQSQNTFVFDVPITANKLEVAAAVIAQYEVGVEDVRIVLVKGKLKASVRKRSRSVMGKRSDVKKAYVRLKEGDSIPVFAAIEEAEAAEQKAEEKAAKKQKKESK